MDNKIINRNFKKTLIFIIVTAFVMMLFSACFPMIHYEGDSMQIAKKRFNSIIEALENKDKNALEGMFSIKAKEEAKDLDKGIEYAMNVYQGKMISSNGVTPSEENINAGQKQLTIKGDYTVETNLDKYSLFFIEKRNTANQDEDGLYMLSIIKEKDEIKYSGKNCAGIVKPDMFEAEDFLNNIIWTLSSQNNEFLESLFSKDAIGDSLNLDYNIEALMSLFQGHMTSFKDCLPPNEISKEQLGNNTVIKGYYEVTTESNIYLVYFIYKRNETDPNEDGLYTLQVVKKVDMNTQFSTKDCAGIYCS